MLEEVSAVVAGRIVHAPEETFGPDLGVKAPLQIVNIRDLYANGLAKTMHQICALLRRKAHYECVLLLLNGVPPADAPVAENRVYQNDLTLQSEVSVNLRSAYPDVSGLSDLVRGQYPLPFGGKVGACGQDRYLPASHPCVSKAGLL